jgi:AcrR family transcriptional regulator
LTLSKLRGITRYGDQAVAITPEKVCEPRKAGRNEAQGRACAVSSRGPACGAAAGSRDHSRSHAAPTHHFGDMTGLLSDLAASGFRKFGATLAAAAAAEPSAADRMNAMGEAYVDFAREHPSMFLLMFRSERLDPARPALRQALEQSSAVLVRGVSERRAGVGAPTSQLAMVADIARSWSMVHGFAMLMIDHRLNTLASHLPQGTTERDLLRAMLRGK